MNMGLLRCDITLCPTDTTKRWHYKSDLAGKLVTEYLTRIADNFCATLALTLRQCELIINQTELNYN